MADSYRVVIYVSVVTVKYEKHTHSHNISKYIRCKKFNISEKDSDIMVEYAGWVIGPGIREYRKSKGFSVEEICDRTGLSLSHIRQIEQGARKISINTLYKLMNALETDANTILSIKSSENLSIKEELDMLPLDKKIYLENVFQYMIREASCSTA